MWQFNFREFNSHIDKHNIFSIEMLKKCGIDFQSNEQFGIDSKVFRDLFMSSRVVLIPKFLGMRMCCGLAFKGDMILVKSSVVDWRILENKLKVERVETKHQAGSDSLLTSRVFWKLQQGFINGSIEPLSGLLYDLGIEQ
ncbi:hypothetical protein SUGI_0210740 [Cryptomeria japonica]|nr:hypothetical protein SUGI_0210740 [Cryptomeria japonica]